ncbi:multidrug resistance-associated protein 1-like isoform X2 [Haliotis rufescens]|uniref:multidrug resistance-associated protein 1-like isoform X2 n=1 Tax=Haliotis rufescens TaxID=6454 RepID=UPI00201EA92B|nr:multidrug resistance-associated protein 1-like isoform X2 [Haliotis rufescens]
MRRSASHQDLRCPEENASALSRFFFLWVGSLIKKANEKPLAEHDIWDLNVRDKTHTVSPVFDSAWKRNSPSSYIRSDSNHDVKSTKSTRTPSGASVRQRNITGIPQSESDANKGTYTINSSQSQPPPLNTKPSQSHGEEGHGEEGHGEEGHGGARRPSLLAAILKSFSQELLLSVGLKLVKFVSLWISSPFLLGLLIDVTADTHTSVWEGVALSVTMVTVMMIGSIIDEQSSYLRQRNNMHIESALKNAIFRKAINLHTSARKLYSMGHMTNLVSGDVSTIAAKFSNMIFILFTPIDIVVIFLQLFYLLGPAAGLGFLVVLILVPINMHISDKITDLFAKNAKHKDEKMKLLNEVLTGMKVLKLNAWEPCFGAKLSACREREMDVLTRMTYYRALHIFSWNTAPYLISMVIFTGYFLLDDDPIFTARTAFSVISALNLLRLAINQAPDIMNDIHSINLSIKRIETFLCESDFKSVRGGDTESSDAAIEITNGHFTWDSNTAQTLSNVNLSIPEGSLVAVVGHVGAGKSSLVAAVLGEIQKVKGHLSVQGRVAYVPQQAWIQNDTLQNNILFGKPMNRQLYKTVIQACALQPDIDMLSAGDLTEIGERGINLSGGQKQRVSLARAVYNDADIYLLDDPLSAVDSHVGKHIFEKVIKGILRNKVVVLVTHNLRYLPGVDNIVVVGDGTVAETGSFRDLLNSDGVFTRVLRSYLVDYEDNRTCMEDFESEGNINLDSDLKSKLKRLDSEDLSENQHFRRQTSKISRQGSRHLSTSSEDKPETNGRYVKEEEITEPDAKEKWSMLRKYIYAYGEWNLVFLLVFYAMYYISWVGANLMLVRWTNDPRLQHVNDSNRSVLDRDVVWRTNMIYLSIYSSLGVALSVFILLYAYMMSRGVVRASKDLHSKMLTNILKSPMEFFDTTPVGRITNRFSHDMKVIDDEMPMCLEFWLDGMVNVVTSMIVVVYSTPQTVLVLIPVVCVYRSLHKYYNTAKIRLSRLTVTAKSPMESHFTESVMGAEIIRAFGDQQRFANKMQDTIDHYHKMRICGRVAYRWIGVQMIGIGNALCGASCLLRSFTKGATSAAMMGLGTTFSLQLKGDMRWLMSLQSDLETNLISMERITQYIHSPNEDSWRKNASQLPRNWPERGRLEFHNYSLRYSRGGDLVLRNISFTVHGGEKVGVVGRTGAGKSSLMLSLFRLVKPAEGAIVIDGVDIADIGLHDLREKLAIIPQDPVLFTGPLRLNLDPQDLYSDQDIWSALDHTHIRQFVESLPDLLQSDCGEGGTNFSVGQRQLFCMSRTLLKKSKILVLDEATAAVDMETDDLIQQTIRSEFKDCTVLTIAHRLNTVMDYDRILVLDNGCVCEFETPSSLLQQPDSIFYSMAKAAWLTS